MLYGERSGGIRTYLDAKSRFAAGTGRFEHHLVVPGKETGRDGCGRHRQRSLPMAPANGYRLPLGGAGLLTTLRDLDPDVVFLHDPFWTPRLVSRAAHEIGAAVIAVHHSTASLLAAGVPGPQSVYAAAMRRWYRRAYLEVDAVMSVVDTASDTRRASTLRLRLGLEPSFRPRPGLPRGGHVLYVGRLSREKGLRELLDAAAAATEPWPLVLIGTGPLAGALQARTRQLGLADRVRFLPFVTDRDELARRYAGAACAVLPGAHETFGLAALEAAACGTTVVTAETTPSASLLSGLVETFPTGDSAALLRALERARTRVPDPVTAQALADRHSWERIFAAELDDLERMLGPR